MCRLAALGLLFQGDHQFASARQITVFVAVSRLAFRNLVVRIEAGEIAAAIYLAAISLCVGLLNAACMTA